jgi:uncharacterized membrane protein
MVDLGPGAGKWITARGEIPKTVPDGAAAMNDLGDFVGEVEVVPPGKEDLEEQLGRTIPFVWKNGHKTVLPTLGRRWTWTTAINNRDAIIGTGETTSGRDHAVLWTPTAHG